MTPTPASVSTPALDRFFTTLHRSPVTRSADRAVAGVSGGVADRLGVSRAIVRVGFVFLALLGPGVLLYLLAWLMLPDAQGQVRLERAVRHGDGSSIVLLIVASLSFVSTVFGGSTMGGPGMTWRGGIWPFLVIAGIALLAWKKGWFSGRGRHLEAPAAPTAPTAPTAYGQPTTVTPPAPTVASAPEGPQDSPRV